MSKEQEAIKKIDQMIKDLDILRRQFDAKSQGDYAPVQKIFFRGESVGFEISRDKAIELRNRLMEVL
jgi:hypothetical protein